MLSIALISCGSATVDMKDLVRSGDMVYVKQTNKGFTGTAVIYDKKTKNKIEEIEFVDGEMHGTSEGWYANGNQSYVATYENGQETSVERWEEDGSSID